MYINGDAGSATIKAVFILLIVLVVGFFVLTGLDKPIPPELSAIPASLIAFLIGTRVQPKDVSEDTKKKAVQEHIDKENNGDSV